MIAGRAEVGALGVTVLFGLSLALAVAALLVERARALLLWPLLLMVGWTNLAWRQAVLSPHDVRVLMKAHAAASPTGSETAGGEGIEAALVTVRGRLAATPVHRLSENFSGAEELRSQAFLRLEAVCFERWQPAFGDLVVSTPGELGPEYFAGQRVEVVGVLRRPKGAPAPNLFDYRALLANRGIYYQLQCAGAHEWRLLDGDNARRQPPLAERFVPWARRTLARGLPEEDEPLRLLWAMGLGWRTALTEEVAEPFMRSGTMHLFAISGLHVALIAGILVALLRVLGVSRAACTGLVVPMLWFYTAATGWQASAVRAAIMMSVVAGGWVLQRPGDLLNSLAAAALLILLWEPRQLFTASFQLSFCVVLSIGLLLPPLARARQRLFQPDPFLPPELRPRWQRWLEPPARFVTTSVAISLAAWLGSLPLVAYYFHLVTPVCLAANLVVTPLGALALMSCLGSLFCGDWLAGVGELFNHSAWFWMLLMARASEWFSALPYAWVAVPPPGATTFVVYFLSLIALASGWVLAPPRRRWAALGAACAVVWVAGKSLWARQTVLLSVLPLNGGQALFLDGPGRDKDWLIDCGDAPLARRVTIPFLRGQGVNRLANFALSHGDMRHIGGGLAIVDEFKPRRVWTPYVRFRSQAYGAVLAQLNAAAVHRPVRRGDPAGPWTVLHPDEADRFARADDGALVLQGEFHGVRVLLLSDLGQEGQARLRIRGYDLRADVVVAGLPARGEPLSAPLVQAIQPRLIVLADADIPMRERASPELRTRLAAGGARVVCTADAGAVQLRIGRRGWELRSAEGRVLCRGKPTG
jgi:ComEC/Rec2-related protein